jgi:nanoRNase/pAp phosphatase (c-di-AMP/oligoRNAs hydrolase)
MIARLAYSSLTMTGFVESFVNTIADSASKIARDSKQKPRVKKLLRALKDKKNILVTTHTYPDPDAIASTHAMTYLLRGQLKDAKITQSIKGNSSCGVNAGFAALSNADFAEWSDEKLKEYDAIVLLDVQPNFSTSPLPAGVVPTAVIDHHRSRGRRQKIPFCDIRKDVGASASIVFSYLRELHMEITPLLAATLMYAIETDLAGAAGNPNDLDNMALSSLMLVADTRKLYQMRYTALPAEFFVSFAHGINGAVYAGDVLATYLGEVESPTMPAIVADFLLRFKGVNWVLVAALHNGRIILSLRTNDMKFSAGEMMRKLTRHIGEGGGHRTKAGGSIAIREGTAGETERLRTILRRRLLKLTNKPPELKFVKLVPACEEE